jgi:alkanesulfonate monooxygenase SsuD/methylene tetrahydromethanopterin reductase-like flavin-dependent oxidoreductase (luciferase family)
VDLGVHLPLLEPDPTRVRAVAEAARDLGFAALAANDHLLFRSPWLDGPTALASVIDSSGAMTLATTAALPVVRGPVALAKALTAIDLLSGGRLTAAVGPGSSRDDYEAVGVPFEERWPRYDAALVSLRTLLDPEASPLAPIARRVPLWVASWGSPAGLRRAARADGWLASAYNTTPEDFAAALAQLGPKPNALATMWTWVGDDGERVLRDVLAPLVGRDPAELRDRVCVGPPEHCAALLSRYAAAGCERVYLWPLADELRQLERIAGDVAPAAQVRLSSIAPTGGPA